MPGVARVKIWVTGEILTAAALNTEIDNLATKILRNNTVETITSPWTFSNGLTVNSGLTLGTALQIAQGGTGSTTASGARSALGLGTMALENIAAIGASVFAGSATFGSVTKYDEVITLTDGPTVTVDLSAGNLFKVTLGGNRTLDFTNLAPGVYIIWVFQDGTGGRTLTHDAAEQWPGGAEPVLSTAANALDILTYVCDGTTLAGVPALDYS